MAIHSSILHAAWRGTLLVAIGPSGIPLIARWLGAALAVVSLALVAKARRDLGRSFSVKAQPKGLVTHGLYARLRHPMYLFVDLAVVGLSLALARPLLLVIVFVAVPIHIYRSRKEDRLLEEKFGEAYRDYRKHTWF
jgi:protein-S-isoprenylcysteine O-methyltransferase Ste14